MPKRVKLLKQYRSYKIGESVLLPDHVADKMMSRGDAKPCGMPTENKAAPPVSMQDEQPKKKRGRPKGSKNKQKAAPEPEKMPEPEPPVIELRDEE